MVNQIPALKVGTGWIELEVVSEAKVVMTFRGYAPIVDVKVLQSGLVKPLYIGSKSLSTQLESLRSKNKGAFTGLRLKVKKESDDHMSPYVVAPI